MIKFASSEKTENIIETIYVILVMYNFCDTNTTKFVVRKSRCPDPIFQPTKLV